MAAHQTQDGGASALPLTSIGLKPSFEIVSIASRRLLCARLVRVKIPMLPSYIGLVARIKAISFGSMLLALRDPLTSLVGKPGATATLVFPTGNCVPVLVRVVRHRCSFRRVQR